MVVEQRVFLETPRTPHGIVQLVGYIMMVEQGMRPSDLHNIKSSHVTHLKQDGQLIWEFAIPYSKNNPEGKIEHKNRLVCMCAKKKNSECQRSLTCSYHVISSYMEMMPSTTSTTLGFMRALNKNKTKLICSNMGSSLLCPFSLSLTANS